MSKITLVKLALLSTILFLIVGCQKQSVSVDQRNSANLVQVKLLSPINGDEIFLNGVFYVIRSDESINGLSRSIVVLRRIGSPGNLLLNVCTPYRLIQDGEYALTGWMRQASTCPGIELIGTESRPGAILVGVKNCTTEPNLDPVFRLPKQGAFFERCEAFSPASDPRQMHGNCKFGSKESAIDSFGLVKCGKQIAPQRK